MQYAVAGMFDITEVRSDNAPSENTTLHSPTRSLPSHPPASLDEAYQFCSITEQERDKALYRNM